MKRFLSIFALALLATSAACSGDADDEVPADSVPATVEPAPPPPAVTPLPDTVPLDTLVPPADTTVPDTGAM